MVTLAPLAGNHKGNSIHAETGDTQLQPKAHDLENLCLHVRVGSIKIRLKIVEAMKVVCLGYVVIVPGALLHPRKYHPGAGIFGFLLGPDIPVAILGLGVAARFLKPWVLVRGVVDHQVDHHAQPTLAAGLGEFHKIAQRTEAGIDPVVIGDIVTVVPAGGWLKGHKPQSSSANALQVVKAAHEASKVANTITIGVKVGGNR